MQDGGSEATPTPGTNDPQWFVPGGVNVCPSHKSERNRTGDPNPAPPSDKFTRQTPPGEFTVLLNPATY
ncbi:MAG: hypothetical protein EBZ69_07230 [Alphaproteobacteria bacterium]|nr:hypothetical protein [Alphaproteobacteria bacterium]